MAAPHLELPPTEYRALVESIAASMRAQLRPAPAPAGQASALASKLENTLLTPVATAADIERICAEAEQWGMAAVCVNPVWVAHAAARLRPTPVAVATVIGFPLGATLPNAKRFEADECLRLGADELDMVINLSALQAGNDAAVGDEIRAIARLAHAAGARVKVILEAALLSRDQKLRACALAVENGADYVKTSTGTLPDGGATVEDVALLRAAVGERAGVKAAGGIRTRAQAEALVAAGATRIGSSAAAALLS